MVINNNNNLTKAERSVLDEGHKLLGDNLSYFLFSGLGETSITHRRAFTARSVPEPSNEITSQFEMINDSSLGLPMSCDPLVMAHLLDLLHKDMRMDDTVDFNVNDILKTLGWAQTAESQQLIKQAVERFASTIYCLIDPAASGEQYRSRFQRLLIRYETISKPLSGEESVQQLLMSVQFLPAFIYHIYTQRKSFLGIDFQQLREMREIPC
jgi:hypothetical protein